MTEFSSANDPAVQEKGPTGLALLAFMGCFMLGGILFLSWLGTPRIEPAEGKSFSKLELKPLAFAEQPLSESDLAGKVTLLHFWGTWCPPCRLEFPLFTKLASEFVDDERVRIVSVATSQGVEYDLEALRIDATAFMEKHSATMPTYADPAGLTRAEAGNILPDGSLPYPSTFLIDASGKIVAVWGGYSPEGMQEVRARLLKLLDRSSNG